MKFKILKNNSGLIIKTKLTATNKLNCKEINKVQLLNSKYFLKPQIINNQVIYYTENLYTNLYERLSFLIGKIEVFTIINAYLNCLEELEDNNFATEYLICDFRYVFVNKITKEIKLIYLPLKCKRNNVDPLDFIIRLIDLLKLNKDDLECFNNFKVFLKNQKVFNKAQIYQYIFLCTDNNTYVNYYGITEKLIKVRKVLFKSGDITSTSEKVKLVHCGTLNINNLNIEDEKETVSLQKNNSSQFTFYCLLYRVKLDETIKIDKPVFRIGKEKSYVDYFIGNNMISRGHADIIKRDERYYIKDLNSKNNTFINGLKIRPEEEVEIYNGDEIKLANEDFVFILK